RRIGREQLAIVRHGGRGHDVDEVRSRRRRGRGLGGGGCLSFRGRRDLSLGRGLGLPFGRGLRLPFGCSLRLALGSGLGRRFGRRRRGRRGRGHGLRQRRLAHQRIAQGAQGGGADRVCVPLQADPQGVLALAAVEGQDAVRRDLPRRLGEIEVVLV